MKIRTAILIVCLAASGASAQSDLQAALLAQSNAAYAAVQKGDLASLKAILVDDFLDVERAGIESTAGLDDEFAHCKTERYEISAPQARALGKDGALLVYEVRQTASCDGHPLPEQMLATDTFIRKNGKWLIVLHTEVAKARPRPAQ